MSKNPRHGNEELFKGKLPPLPERALTGLPSEMEYEIKETPFHTVHVWEFTNLYVLLNHQLWSTISTFLKNDDNLTAVARELERGHGTLFAIRKNPNQSIHIDMLKAIVQVSDSDYDLVERSIRAVKFGQRGEPEKIEFPFTMDLYAWRVICHIIGDGNVQKRDDRPYPYLRWTQEVKNQEPMRLLLQRLSRAPGGKTMNVNYPKALSYVIMGTMPYLKLYDLKSTKFLQFILDLPSEYRDYKVQFVAAFINDDGSVTKGKISFVQKKETILNYILNICDQLGYDHSKLYHLERDGVHNFQLRQEGIKSFYNDLHIHNERDNLLGLWHKHSKLMLLTSSFSKNRKKEQDHSTQLCTMIIRILSKYKVLSTEDLWKNQKFKDLLKGYSYYLFRRKLILLKKMNIVEEIKQNDGKSFRPKHWRIPSNSQPEELIKRFNNNYNNRAHKHSYKRKSITVSMVEKAITKLKDLGIEKPSAAEIAKEIGCSKKQLYKRDDLRGFFVGK